MWLSTQEMLKDVGRFSALLVISVFSFAFAFAFIARDLFCWDAPEDFDISADCSHGSGSGWSHFSSIPSALQFVALGVFDPIEVLQPEEKLDWNFNADSPVVILRSALFLILFFMYLFFMILLMTNLIIAVMTSSYQRIDRRKTKTELLKMQAAIQYQQLPLIPPPLNLLRLPAYILHGIAWILYKSIDQVLALLKSILSCFHCKKRQLQVASKHPTGSTSPRTEFDGHRPNLRAFQSAVQSDSHSDFLQKRGSIMGRSSFLNLNVDEPPDNRFSMDQAGESKAVAYRASPETRSESINYRKRKLQARQAIIKQTKEKVKSLFERSWNNQHDLHFVSSHHGAPSWAVQMMSYMAEADEAD